MSRMIVKVTQDLEEGEEVLAGMNRENAAYKRRHRDAINDLKEENKLLKVTITELSADKDSAKERFEDIEKAIQDEAGPFSEDFNRVLDEMALKRQVYHSGALVGNDVRKVLRPENIEKLGMFSSLRYFPLMMVRKLSAQLN